MWRSISRLKAAIEREKKIPRVFESARANLKNPPKIYTEVALEQLPGIVSFFREFSSRQAGAGASHR